MSFENNIRRFSGGGGGGGGAPAQTQAQIDAEARQKVLDEQLIAANKVAEVDRQNNNARMSLASTEKAQLQTLIDAKRRQKSQGNSTSSSGYIGGTGVQISTGS